MDWSIWSGPIGNLGSNLTSSLLSLYGQSKANKANIAMNRENNLTNLAINRAQIENGWKMWKATNAYNTPTQQRARLIAAGVNPQSLVDNGQAGMFEFPQSHATQRPAPVQNEFAGFNLGSVGSDIASGLMAKRQLEHMDYENTIKGVEAATAAHRMSLDIQQKIATLENTRSLTANQREQLNLLRQQYRHLEKLNVFLLQKAQFDTANSQKQGALFDAEIGLTNAETQATIQRVINDTERVRETVRHNRTIEGIQSILAHNEMLNGEYNRRHVDADTKIILQKYEQSGILFEKIAKGYDLDNSLKQVELKMGEYPQ